MRNANSKRLLTPRDAKPTKGSMGRHKRADSQLEILSARVKKEIYRDIKAIAKSRDVTVTFLVREALREFVKNHTPESQVIAT